MVYTFHNPHYSGGEYLDFVSVTAGSYDEAWEKANVPYIGFRLWSITKGVTLADFKQPTK